jgi:hypothetical protein
MSLSWEGMFAYAVDAMSLSWEGMFAYAFHPFRFLAPVLHKITGEKCRIIVIAPAWPKQACSDSLRIGLYWDFPNEEL